MPPYADTRTQPGPVYDDGDERAARRTLRFFAAAVFVAVLGATLVLSLGALDDEAPATARPGPVETVTTLAPVAGVGPEPGAAVAAYVSSRKSALATATDERVAVVSLVRYSTQAQAKALVGTASVVGLLVAPPGIGPALVTGDLAAWAKTETAATTSERDEIRKLIPTVTDPGFKAFYTAEVTRLDKALKGFAPDSAMVFGLVVRAPAAALQALAAKTEVRLVDVGASALSPAGTMFRGLRPEEVIKADDPPMRPV